MISLKTQHMMNWLKKNTIDKTIDTSDFVK